MDFLILLHYCSTNKLLLWTLVSLSRAGGVREAAVGTRTIDGSRGGSWWVVQPWAARLPLPRHRAPHRCERDFLAFPSVGISNCLCVVWIHDRLTPPSPSQHTPPSYPDCLGACLIFHPFCKPLNTSTILNKLKWKKISAGLSSSSFARICGPRFHNFTLFIQLKHNYLSLPFNFACWRLAVRSVSQHLSSVWYFSHRQSTKSVETWDKKVGKEMSRWV